METVDGIKPLGGRKSIEPKEPTLKEEGDEAQEGFRAEDLRNNTLKNISDESEEEFGLPVTEEDITDFNTDTPKEAEFPSLILIFAILKDSGDVLTGTIFGIVFSFIMAGILYVWLTYYKVGRVRQALLKWAVRRVIIVLAADSLPLVDALPWTTIFVLLAYYRETQIVKFIWSAVDKMRSLNLKNGGEDTKTYTAQEL